MKVYKIEMLVIDHGEIGSNEIKGVIENIKYPNWCISPEVKKIEERDIGNWSDYHPLNFDDTSDTEYRRLFGQPTT